MAVEYVEAELGPLSSAAVIAHSMLQHGYELAVKGELVWLVAPLAPVGWNMQGNALPYHVVGELWKHQLIVPLDHTYEALGKPFLYGGSPVENV